VPLPQGDESRAADAPTTRIRDDVHALDLGGVGVKSLETAAADRPVAVVGNEESAVGPIHLGCGRRRRIAEVGVAVDLLVVGEGRRDQRACRFAVGVDGAKLDGHLAAPYARRQCLTPGTRPACAGSTIRYAGCPGRANRVALVRLIADGVAACPRCSTGERLSVVGLPITCAWCGGRAVVSLERARPLYAQLQSKAEREPAAPERRAA
jgi:hypothetical protein